MGKYKMWDINVDDGAFFKLEYQTNYDLYWTVISKFVDTLEIELNKEMGITDKISLHINDVYLVEKRT